MVQGQETILITGASGYLGGRVAAEIAHGPHFGEPLFVIPLRDHGERPWTEVCDHWCQQHGISRDRVTFVATSLEEDAPFHTVDPNTITRVFHHAAVTRFNVEREIADEVNIAGSRKVFSFARSCPNLKGVYYASTVYASGLAAGKVAEEILPQQPFANHYERSKWETERLLCDEFQDLPWQIHRVATILCDDQQGGVTQQNAVHNTMKLLYYGLLSLVPGKPETPVYLVTGSFCAQAIIALAENGKPHEVYQICHEKDHNPTLGQVIDIAFKVFNHQESFAKRHIKKPIFVDEVAFETLSEGVGGFGGAVVTEALGSVMPFSKQLFVTKDFANERLQAAFPAYETPEVHEILERTLTGLAEEQWNRKKNSH